MSRPFSPAQEAHREGETLGFSAATIAPDQRGIGFLLAEDGLPVRMRAFHLDDAAIDALASRAALLRGAG